MSRKNTTVWCLLIDHNCKPTFGEPFSVSICTGLTVHDLKIRICQDSRGEPRRDIHVATNRVEIWRCKKLKLFAKDSFHLIKKQLSNLKFSDDEDSDAQHLAAAQSVTELELEHSELLLALVPQYSMRHLFPTCVLLTELSAFPGGI